MEEGSIGSLLFRKEQQNEKNLSIFGSNKSVGIAVTFVNHAHL